MRKFLTSINNFFAEISGWFLSFVAFLLLLNILTRYLGMPIQGLLEISTFAFIIVVYLGLAHCEENDEHIKVNAIIKRLPKTMNGVLHIFNYVLTIFISGILIYASLKSAIEAYISNESLPGTAPLPTFPVKFIIFSGLLFFCFQVIVNLYRYIKKLGSRKDNGEFI